MDDLQVDDNTFARLTCCGKAMHKHCNKRIKGSTMSMALKNKCPQCRAKFPTSYKGTVKQVRKWANADKAWAQTTLAELYHRGRGVPQSDEEAIRYYEMAVEQGDPNAMCDLACMYEIGEGVAKSLEKAVELFASAANQGHARAQYNLGCSYREGKGGVAQSYEKAFGLFTLAANQRHAGAQYNLGIHYYQGNGVAQSNAMARKWWLKAARQEYEEAIRNLKTIDQQEGKTTPTLPRCAACNAN